MTITAAPPARSRRPLTAARVLAGTLLAGLTSAVMAWAVYLQALVIPVAAVLIAIALVDARTLTLPNRLVAPLTAAALAQLAVGGLHGHSPLPALAAGSIVFAGYLLMAGLGWCGAGDAKFAGAATLLAGLYVGLLAVYVLPVAMILAAGHIAVSRLAGRRAHRHPHGPEIAAATLLLITIGLLPA